MKAFFDTNVLVAAVVTDTNRSDVAIALLIENTQRFTRRFEEWHEIRSR